MSEVLTTYEALQAAFEGKDLQFKTGEFSDWRDSAYNGNKYELVMQVAISSTCYWRIKPDAFEEAWATEFQKQLYKTFDRDSISKSHTIFKAGWDAAMEHKDNEHFDYYRDGISFFRGK